MTPTQKLLVRIITIVLVILIIIFIVLCKYIKDNLKSGGAQVNAFLDKHCSDPAILDSKDHPWSVELRKHWKDIRGEYEDYAREFVVPAYRDVTKESAGNIGGWKAIFLRVFNNDTKMMAHFPKTKKLLSKCPCTSAYFSMLEPGTHIPKHKGVYKGVIRYHLGLVVPDDWENCFIDVDGHKLYWHEGKDIMFDDLFDHFVENNTSQQRVVLFLDIRRDFRSLFLNLLNRLMLRYIKCNDALLTAVEKANRLSRQKAEQYSFLTANAPPTPTVAETLQKLVAKANLISTSDIN